jgi:hypothetical protein
MKFAIIKLISAILFCSLTTTAFADRKPNRGHAAPASKIIQMYQGKTDLWKQNCNGGIYLSPQGQARAWCADKSDNFGSGKWTADNQGRLCHNLNWYWRDGQRVGKSPGGEQCISHVIDGLGRMWRSWPNSPEWWRVYKHGGNLVRGYKFQNEVHQTRAHLGL